jgi:RNA polymerase sigma factor (sigma-70 family)
MPSPSSVLLRTQSDERLVALARAGHDRAFEAIVERYRRPLLRACRRILPEARAEDALQQALVAAWTGLRRGDDVHELRPWLYRIVRNTALNQLRVAGYDLDELMDSLSAADDPQEEVLRRAVVRQTLAAVAALPERQREALLRTAINGDMQEEVARDLGLSNTATRQLVHRARVAVRAAATAVVPMPVATWLAAGAGGAGTAATLAKAGTLVVLAGGAVSAPVLIEHGPPTPRQQQAQIGGHRDRAAPRGEAQPAAAPAVTATAPAATATPARVRATAPAAPRRSAVRRDSRGSGRGSDHETEAPAEDHSGSGGGGDDVSHSGPGGGGSSGSGGGSGDGGHHGGNSGPGGGGGGDDAVAVTTPTATPTPEAAVAEEETEDHHGGGSNSGPGGGGGGDDSSGSGSSGSGGSGG